MNGAHPRRFSYRTFDLGPGVAMQPGAPHTRSRRAAPPALARVRRRRLHVMQDRLTGDSAWVLTQLADPNGQRLMETWLASQLDRAGNPAQMLFGDELEPGMVVARPRWVWDYWEEKRIDLAEAIPELPDQLVVKHWDLDEGESLLSSRDGSISIDYNTADYPEMFVVLEQGRQRNPYTKPYEPEWRSEPGLTETQRKKQRALRSMWKKESKKRGKHVDAQPEIEKLRDMRHPDGSPRALFAVSHSGGKDSQAMLTQVRKVIPDDQIVLVHAPLHGVEWDGIVDQVERYADGLPIIYAPAQDKQGDEKWLLERVLERGMWPSTGQRWCTSDFKRGPIRREVRRYADSKGFDIIVEGLGLRAQESDARGFRPALAPLKAEDGKIKATAPRWRRRWYHWHPIKWMTTDQVFRTIKDAKQEPFWTYAEGMTRASCAFCIMASSSDLAVAARLAPDLYAQYVAVEKVIGHTLDQQGRPLEEVTGTPADPELVRKYVRKIMKTGELRDITEAGQRPKKRKRPRRRGSVRLPVVRGGQLPLMNPARTINERLGLLHYPVGIDTEYLVLYDVELAFRDIDSAVVGAMLIGGTDDEGYRQVVMSAAERGWGPALYTAAMDRVRPLALVPDRHYGRVTPEAHRLYVRFGSGTDVKQVSIPDELKVHGDPTLDAGYTLSPTSSGARILTEHVEAAEELGDAFVSQYSAREGYDRAATHTLLVEAADSFMRSRIRA